MSWLLPLPVPALLRSPRPAKIGSASDQIRGIKTALCSSYVLFLRRGLGTVKLLFTEPRSRLFVFFLFFFFCLFLGSVSHHSRLGTTCSVPKHTRRTRSYFDFSHCQMYTVLSAHFSFSHTSFWQKPPQPSRFCLWPSPSLRRFKNVREGYWSVNFSL